MSGALVFFLDHLFACTVGGFLVCLAAVYAVARIPEQTRDTSC